METVVVPEKRLRAPRAQARLIYRWPDMLAAIGWSFPTGFRLAMLIAEPSPLQAGLFIFNLIVMALFILRRPARAQGSRRDFWLAMGAAFLPAMLLRTAEVGVPILGEFMQIIGIVIMLTAILSLNRSFGIAPAHRGLVSRGLYRTVRHPLYAGEMIAIGGYCLGYATVGNGVVWLAFAIAQMLRIRAEENLLSSDAEYAAYQAQVPWRLVPRVW